MRIIAIIPAHMSSLRFPKKILFPIHGLPMIEHVRRRALLCDTISNVFVATCDDEIKNTIQSYGGDVIMTSNTHSNGTSRVAEAVEQIDCTHVVLLQGDEPLLLPRHVKLIVKAILENENGDAWNATGPIENEDELNRHSFVKCVTSKSNRIMHCFRRTPSFSDFSQQKLYIRKILGVIAYRKKFLLELTKAPGSLIEISEAIEQMRILENNWTLQSVPVAPSLPSVNEPHEVDIVLNYIKSDLEQRDLLSFIIRENFS